MKNDQRRLRDRVAVFACIAIATIAIDQLTKMWALSRIGRWPYHTRDSRPAFVDIGA